MSRLLDWRYLPLSAAVLMAVPVFSQAQTSTPTVEASTPTPTATVSCPTEANSASCAGAKKLQLRWSARKPFEIKAFLSATHCEVPPRCAGTSIAGAVTTGPITVTVKDATGYTVTTTIDEPLNSAGGCPGGVDTYRNKLERMRFIYGADSFATLVGMLTFDNTDGSPPVLMAPLTFSVRDACGYDVEGEVSTCFTKQTATRTSLKCF